MGGILPESLNLSGKGCGDNFKGLVLKWDSSASDPCPRNFLTNQPTLTPRATYSGQTQP